MLVIYSCTELTVHHQYHHPLTQIQITAITSHFRDNKSLCFLSLHPLFYFKERIYMGLGFKRLITAWHCNTEYTFCVGVGMRTNRVTRLRRHVTRVTWLCVTCRDETDVTCWDARQDAIRDQLPFTGGWKSENNIPGMSSQGSGYVCQF